MIKIVKHGTWHKYEVSAKEDYCPVCGTVFTYEREDVSDIVCFEHRQELVPTCEIRSACGVTCPVCGNAHEVEGWPVPLYHSHRIPGFVYKED